MRRTARTLGRALGVVLALAVALAGIVAVIEILAAPLRDSPLVVPYDEWYGTLRNRTWDEAGVRAVLAGTTALGAALLALALTPWQARTATAYDDGTIRVDVAAPPDPDARATVPIRTAHSEEGRDDG